MSESSQTWKSCSSCKTPIRLGGKYYVCSVSTCNSKRTGYSFCSVSCFERHLPGARHKDAAAVEETAPLVSGASGPNDSGDSATRPARRIVVGASTSSSQSSPSAAKAPQETLIIASRLKDYIQARGGMNTASSVMDVLSEKVRALCDEAIESARRDGRKTVMDRDF